MIRLREHHNNNVFLPWESLLGTLVHELVHIEISSHSYEFYKLVDELSDQVQDDMLGRSSSSSSYIFSESGGHRLGGNSMPGNSSLRELSLSAASKRQRLNDLCPSTGQRLGGSSYDTKIMSRQELMARAAERRLRDNQACADQLSADDQEVQALEEVDLSGVIYDFIDLCRPCRPTTTSSNTVVDLATDDEIISSNTASTKRKPSYSVIDLTDT
jgi:DNA-dependent metalloprotease WSS1